MTYENKKILIVEDNIAEAIYAQSDVARAGFRDISVSQNLESALNVLEREKYDYILSDLFFPIGNTNKDKYISEIVPLYETYADRRFTKITDEDNVIKRTCEHIAKSFGITVEEYLEKLLPTMINIPKVISAAKDAVYGRRDYEKYLKFQKTIAKVKDGSMFPSGLYVVEKATELEIPIIIVTSTYHHDAAFEAIRDKVNAPYIDTLEEDGRKNWSKGIEKLLKH